MTSNAEAFLCVGAAHWDLICRAETTLKSGSDVPGSVTRRAGGVALNVAAGLAHAGCRTSLCAAVGGDPEGDQLVDWAMSQGIDCAGVVRAPNRATDIYVAIEQPSGALFGAVARSALPERLGPEIADQAKQSIRRGTTSTVLLDANLSTETLLDLAQAARDAGCALAINPVSPVKAPRLRCLLEEGLMPQIIGNREEAEAITGCVFANSEEAGRALFRLGARSCLISDGANPAALVSPAGSAIAEIHPVVRASVTGAGDALMAGYLACAERDVDPHAALGTALSAAARHMETSA